MRRTVLILIAAGLALGSLAGGETPAIQPANELADAMAQRLSKELHVKTVVGEPVKVGTVTLIPIMMIDVSFGGAGMPASAGADGFYMSGEARPMGFVAITKTGTRFISLSARKPQ